MPIKMIIEKCKAMLGDKKMKKSVIWAVILIAAFFLVKPFFVKPHKPEMPARPVETAIAEQKDVPLYLVSFGNMVAPQDVAIKAQVTGEVREVHFTDGMEVKKDDLLFTIDERPYKAELEKAEANLAQDTVNLKLARDTLKRNESLISSNLISKQDFEKYQTDVSAMEAKVRLDTASVDLAKINLGYCSILSPINGLTGKRQVDPGNIVIGNNGPTLVTVKTIDSLYVDFTIPEKDLMPVRQAMSEGKLSVEISVEGDTDGPYKGDVIFIDNTVDNSTGTVMMRAVVNNEKRNLWAGQFVTVKLILGISAGAVLVPYEAVQIGQKGHYLFAVTPDNRAEVRIVKTGSRQGDKIVVKDGVSSGERVVTSGQLGLSQGVPVVDVAAMKAAGNTDQSRKK